MSATTANLTEGTVTIGRNTFPATKDSEGTVTYVTSKGEQFATARVAKSFARKSTVETAVENAARPTKPIALIASGPDTRPVNEAKVAKQEAKAEAPKPAAKPSKPAKAKVEVTDEDRAQLVWVASIQKKPSARHLKGCSHFYPEGSDKDPKWVPATPEQLESLKPCPTDAFRAAKARVTGQTVNV